MSGIDDQAEQLAARVHGAPLPVPAAAEQHRPVHYGDDHLLPVCPARDTDGVLVTFVRDDVTCVDCRTTAVYLSTTEFVTGAPFRAELLVPGGYEQLHVRAYAAGVSEVRERLAAIAPPAGPYGLINAATALGAAVVAIEQAHTLAAPHAPSRQDGQQVNPSHVATVVDQLVSLVDELAYMAGQLAQQLAHLHTDALGDRIAGPPGSTPSAEVEKVVKSVLDVDTAISNAGRALATARARVLRLTMTGSG